VALAWGAGGCGLLPEQEAQTESVALEQPTAVDAAESTDDPTTEPTPPDPTPADPTTGDMPTAPTEPEDPASEESTTSLQSGSATTLRDQDLDLTDRHPNGTRLDVTAIRFEGTAILVDAELINGHTDDIRINLQSRHAGIRLLDDLGNIYQVRPPDDTTAPNLTIASGETLSGSWAFLGPIDPDAQEAAAGDQSVPERPRRLRPGDALPRR
jgi:type IV secretory pathway VirB10-like protein